jgi:hypothetical protein
LSSFDNLENTTGHRPEAIPGQMTWPEVLISLISLFSHFYLETGNRQSQSSLRTNPGLSLDLGEWVGTLAPPDSRGQLQEVVSTASHRGMFVRGKGADFVRLISTFLHAKR